MSVMVQVIFIHINKCGGTSVKKCLESYKNVLICTNNIQNSTKNISIVQRTPLWKSAFTFTIVRHPFSRLISAYKMFHRENSSVTLQQVINIALDKQIGYNNTVLAKKNNSLQFCMRSTKPKPKLTNNLAYVSRIKRHTLPMTHPHYGIVRADDTITVDFVAHLENIANDWKIVEQHLGKEVPLPKANATNDNHVELSPAQVSALYAYYKRDFKVFGYDPKVYREMA